MSSPTHAARRALPAPGTDSPAGGAAGGCLHLPVLAPAERAVEHGGRPLGRAAGSGPE